MDTNLIIEGSLVFAVSLVFAITWPILVLYAFSGFFSFHGLPTKFILIAASTTILFVWFREFNEVYPKDWWLGLLLTVSGALLWGLFFCIKWYKDNKVVPARQDAYFTVLIDLIFILTYALWLGIACLVFDYLR